MQYRGLIFSPAPFWAAHRNKFQSHHCLTSLTSLACDFDQNVSEISSSSPSCCIPQANNSASVSCAQVSTETLSARERERERVCLSNTCFSNSLQSPEISTQFFILFPSSLKRTRQGAGAEVETAVCSGTGGSCQAQWVALCNKRRWPSSEYNGLPVPCCAQKLRVLPDQASQRPDVGSAFSQLLINMIILMAEMIPKVLTGRFGGAWPLDRIFNRHTIEESKWPQQTSHLCFYKREVYIIHKGSKGTRGL